MTKDQQYEKFRQDMENAGRTVEEYGGRNFYRGPSVRCEYEELQDVIRDTSVRVITDHMGLGLVVYPG